MTKQDTSQAMSIKLSSELPPYPEFITEFKGRVVRRAPKRKYQLTRTELVIALKNALRYVPAELHVDLAPEFLTELSAKGDEGRGRIYGYRFRPPGVIKAKPIDQYQGVLEARALQVMLDNNVDFDIALYPYELVTYGESGQVCQNWMQFQLIKKYLEVMTEEQTLVVSSGHPVGLFPSRRDAPRVISTNGLMVGEFDAPEPNDLPFLNAAAMGVTNYGQMTAGGWMYIGPQGIVHGTYITLLNAGRKYLDIPIGQNLGGKVYLSSGLGGMSGAQGRAVEIAGGIGVIAEVDAQAINTRKDQNWVKLASADLDEVFQWVEEYRVSKEPISIAYHGNIVDLWDYVVRKEILIELASDQTSCHNVYSGGYWPAGLSYEEARHLLETNLERFKAEVNRSLRRQFELIREMTRRGTRFWDYGNSFMVAVLKGAGVKEIKNDRGEFIFPSYVEHLMGPLYFDYGYGPFRWVCLSCKEEDLKATDEVAMSCIDPDRRTQDYDNFHWIKDARENKLVVGSQARILYQDAEGRVRIALKFNEMVRQGLIGPVMLGRDHHDTGGTDSPYRETANIRDGSFVTADMAHQCWAGNAARGMTLCVLSNGGGVGTGRSINGGFGLVLDGSPRIDQIIRSAIDWDAMGGVARRAWARNKYAIETAAKWNVRMEGSGQITLPHIPRKGLVEELVENAIKQGKLHGSN